MSPFKEPNYTALPNELFDILPDMGYAELKVTLVALRETLGFHRESARLSQRTMKKLTGLSAPAVLAGAEAAVKRGTFERSYAEDGSAVWSVLLESEGIKLLLQGVKQLDTPPAKQLDRGYKVTLPPSFNKEKIKQIEDSGKCTTREVTDTYLRVLELKADEVSWANGEAKAAKFIAQRWTVEQIEASLKKIQSDPFWRDKLITLAYLKKQMPVLVKSGNSNNPRQNAPATNPGLAVGLAAAKRLQSEAPR